MKYFLSLIQMFNLTMYVDGGEGGGSDGGDGSGGEGDGSGAGGDAGAGGDGGDGSDGTGGDTPPADAPPALLAGKYKDQEALEAGYVNLAKKFGSFTGAPEDGYAAIEGVENTTPDQNRLMAVLQEAGKEAGMSQDGYAKLYGDITAMQDRVAEENLAAVQKDIPNYETRAKDMANLASRLLRPDQVSAIDGLMTTKESFEAFESIISSLKGGALPGSQPPAEVDVKSLQRELHTLAPANTQRRSEILKEINKHGAANGLEGRLV